MTPEYSGRNRFPKKQPKGICRGCRGPITEKRRLTWCSDACHKKFDPFHVKQAVRKRSGEKCEMCGRDCSRQACHLYVQSAPQLPTYTQCGLEYPYDYKSHYSHPLYKGALESLKVWRREKPKPEYDHILPHCEGGLFTVENIRLLCRPCHLKRTAEWRRTRKKL